jgi:hypothetical protein
METQEHDGAQFERFKLATEEFFQDGTCSVACEKCGGVIMFEKMGESAWKHHCPCGRYKGTLRGI